MAEPDGCCPDHLRLNTVQTIVWRADGIDTVHFRCGCAFELVAYERGWSGRYRVKLGRRLPRVGSDGAPDRPLPPSGHPPTGTD